MLTIFDRSPLLCDGLSRRALLQASGLGSVSLAASAALGDSPSPRARSCIVIFLLGGPPQQSTWDPKPSAPPEIRGEFGPIDTNVPGIQVSELFPNIARHMDKLAILRAVSTGDNAHSSSGYYMLTGVPHVPKQVENANPGAPNNHPTLGAVVQSLSRDRSLLPASIRLPMRISTPMALSGRGRIPGGWDIPRIRGCSTANRVLQTSMFRSSGSPLMSRSTASAGGNDFSTRSISSFANSIARDAPPASPPISTRPSICSVRQNHGPPVISPGIGGDPRPLRPRPVWSERSPGSPAC